MATQELTREAGRLIRIQLERRGMTQEQLSDRSGIPMRTLSRRLHKIRPSSIPLDELGSIADALEVPVVSLIAGGEILARAA